MTETAPQPDVAAMTFNSFSRDRRKHVLAGLAIARRTLANAKDDAAMGITIDPATIAELERVVAEYVEMLDRAESSRVL